MPTLFGTLLGQGGVHKSISFDDFSLGTVQDAEESLSPRKGGGMESEVVATAEDTAAAAAPDTPPAAGRGGMMPKSSDARSNVWGSIFNPGRNNNPQGKDAGVDFFDHTHTPADDARSVWDEVIKSERLKSFASLDRDNDGYISASDLKAALGSGADVEQMIKAADTTGNGKIDYAEFSELLRNS